MKQAQIAALGLVLALAALAPAASAQGMILDPDGAPGAWSSLVSWWASLFEGTSQDPNG